MLYFCLRLPVARPSLSTRLCCMYGRGTPISELGSSSALFYCSIIRVRIEVASVSSSPCKHFSGGVKCQSWGPCRSIFMRHVYVGREMWDGPRPGPDGALELTGVDEVHLLCVSKSIVTNRQIRVLISCYSYIYVSGWCIRHTCCSSEHILILC